MYKLLILLLLCLLLSSCGYIVQSIDNAMMPDKPHTATDYKPETTKEK